MRAAKRMVWAAARLESVATLCSCATARDLGTAIGERPPLLAPILR